MTENSSAPIVDSSESTPDYSDVHCTPTADQSNSKSASSDHIANDEELEVDEKMLTILLKTLTHGDKRITCGSERLVRELKAQISREFPSRPKVSDQKLIHAGILLKDDTKLSSAFKMQMSFVNSEDERSSKEYIVHLVCNVKGSPVFKRHQPGMFAQRTETSIHDRPETESARSSSSSESNRATGGSPAQSGSDSVNLGILESSLKFVKASLNEEQYARLVSDMHQQHRTFYESVRKSVQKSFELGQTGPVGFVTGITDSQAVLGSTGENVASPDVENPARLVENEREIGQGVNVQVEQQRNNVPGVMNAAAGFDGAQNEEAEDNDWLSWLYRESRLVVLLIILYSYSSLHRVLTVAVISALMYFFQRRWLPLFGRELMRRNDDNNNNNNNNNNNGVDNVENNGDVDNENNNEEGISQPNNNTLDPSTAAQGSALPGENGNEQSSSESQQRSRVRAPAPPTPNRAARFYSAMETFLIALTTFFVSLFPIELRQQNL